MGALVPEASNQEMRELRRDLHSVEMAVRDLTARLALLDDLSRQVREHERIITLGTHIPDKVSQLRDRLEKIERKLAQEEALDESSRRWKLPIGLAFVGGGIAALWTLIREIVKQLAELMAAP